MLTCLLKLQSCAAGVVKPLCCWRRAFNKDKVTPRTNSMVEEFKPGRGAGGKAAAGAMHAVSSYLLSRGCSLTPLPSNGSAPVSSIELSSRRWHRTHCLLMVTCG